MNHTRVRLKGYNSYPHRDGRLHPEPDWHKYLQWDLVTTLQRYYADDPHVYVSADLFIFYEQHVKQSRIAPDVFVVKGVPRGMRPNFLLWEEGHAPDVAIEITSRRTRKADEKKVAVYRDVLKVREYFLFDQREEYLHPSLQGFRLSAGQYSPIPFQDGRLPSRVLGLHLERSGEQLLFWNPATGQPFSKTAESTHSQMLAEHQSRTNGY